MSIWVVIAGAVVTGLFVVGFCRALDDGAFSLWLASHEKPAANIGKDSPE